MWDPFKADDAVDNEGYEDAEQAAAGAAVDIAAATVVCDFGIRRKSKLKKFDTKKWRLRHELTSASASSTTPFMDLAHLVALDVDGTLVIYDFFNALLKSVHVGIVSCDFCF